MVRPEIPAPEVEGCTGWDVKEAWRVVSLQPLLCGDLVPFSFSNSTHLGDEQVCSPFSPLGDSATQIFPLKYIYFFNS